MQPERNRVVARFNDGRVLKGYTHDFVSEKDIFHLTQLTDRGEGASQEIRVSELKAVFFVKALEGDKDHKEKKDFADVAAAARHGIKIKVTFKDGEVMRGFSLGYNRTKKGFFIIPIDSKGNNDRIYIVAGSTARIIVGPNAEK